MSRRLRWALLASVLVHLALAWLLRSLPEEPAPSQATNAPIQLEVVVLEPVVPPAPAPEPAPEPEPPARVAPRVRASAAAPPSAPQPEPLPSKREAGAADAPRASSLVTSGDFLRVEPEAPRGRTLRNDPSELPDPAAVLAQEGERVRGRVQGFADDELASARVESGLVNPYFHALRRELTAGLAHPPEVFDPNQTNEERLRDWGSQLVQSMSGGYKRYGATGSPQTPSKLDELARSGEVRATVGRATLERGARLREFADGRAGVDLIAIVELVQAGDGSLQSAVMLQASGVKPFDAWVLRMAETSVDALADAPPDAGAKSVWEFKGRVSYVRTSKEFDAKQDAWYVILMAPLGMTPGSFDEVNGTVQYVDLRYPHYEATVRLLQAY